MSNSLLGPKSRTRFRLMASAAALALIGAGAAGVTTLSQPQPAHAAAVDTSGLEAQSPASFAPMIARVKPAVVSIRVKMETKDSSNNGPEQFQNVPPQLRQFFWRFGYGKGFPHFRRAPTIGEGSGFFVSSDGYIVTNNHVVADAKTVTVTMNNGKTLRAKVVGTDPKSDLAVLKVEAKGDYPYVSFASQKPRIGDWVVAIGNPYGLGGTATAGIVSAEGRSIGTDPYDAFLQIDAPINRGNSGGPTFNAEGQVVGVNTAIVTPSGGSVGIGFAIPADAVKPVIEALEHHGVVTRGYLGVLIQPVSQDMADSLGMKEASGAIVDKVEPGTPAFHAGLESGDVITKVNGVAVADSGDLSRRIGSLKPGDKVELTYLRNGETRTANITLASQKNPKVAMAEAGSDSARTMLGVDLEPASQVAGAGNEGVAMINIDPDGPAASKGLTDGDVILKVSGKSVSNPDEVKTAINDARRAGKKAVLFQVKTKNGDRFVAFTFPGA